jgi:hypothetical protein
MFIHILLYSILCYSQFGLAWPCFGRQRGSLIFHRSALHKLLNLCLSLFPEVSTASSEMDLKSGSGIKQLKSQAFSVPPGRIPRPPQQCLAPTSAPPPWCVLPVWRNHAHSPTIKPRNLEKLEICVRQVPVYKRERRLRVINQVHDAYHIIPIIPYPLQQIQQIQQIISNTMRTFHLGSSEVTTAIKSC